MYAFNAIMHLENPIMLPAVFNHLPGIAAATVASVDRGLYRHVGLLTEPVPGFERRVLSLNPGPPGEQLREEALSAFRHGQPVTLLPPWSDLPAWAVLARARGSVLPSYSWTEFNCEHFLCHAFGVPLRSPQLARGLRLAGLAAAALLLTRAAA
jgi:hypothetical protein